MRIGFLGGGAMAEAMLTGILHKQLVDPQDIFVSDHKEDRAQELAASYQVQARVGSAPFLPLLDVLILAVKPKHAQAAMCEVANGLSKQAAILSIVAGLSLDQLETHFPHHPLMRAMPNLPLTVGEGASAYALRNTTPEAMQGVIALLAASGRAIPVEEALLHAVTGLSGSGPAFILLFLEAMIEGGIAAGLSRETARILATQTFLGTAKLAITSGLSLAELKQRVTSPAGTTAAGLLTLEEHAVRGHIMRAILKASQRAQELEGL